MLLISITSLQTCSDLANAYRLIFKDLKMFLIWFFVDRRSRIVKILKKEVIKVRRQLSLQKGNERLMSEQEDFSAADSGALIYEWSVYI